MSGHGAAGGLCLAWGERGGGPRPRIWARQKGGPLRVRGTLAGRSGGLRLQFRSLSAARPMCVPRGHRPSRQRLCSTLALPLWAGLQARPATS